MTDMPSAVRQLINALASRTQRGQLEWKQGSADTEFVLTTDKGAVVTRSVDDDGRHPFRFGILNADGEEVESWVSTDPAADEWYDWANDLETLYGAARRQALGSTPGRQRPSRGNRRDPGSRHPVLDRRG